MYTIYIHANNIRKEYTVIDKEWVFDLINTARKAIDFISLDVIDAFTGEVLLTLESGDYFTDEMRQIKSVLDWTLFKFRCITSKTDIDKLNRIEYN